MKNKLLIFALSALSAVICGCSTLIPDESYDVVVYGGTSAGVTSAVQAAKSGKKVVLIAPEGRLGAMSSSGLGMTDSGKIPFLPRQPPTVPSSLTKALHASAPAAYIYSYKAKGYGLTTIFASEVLLENIKSTAF